MSILEGPRKTYEFWRERRTGEVWAVELADGIVVGCCGPLHHRDVDAGFLHAFDYEAGEAARIEAGRDGFDLVDPAVLDGES